MATREFSGKRLREARHFNEYTITEVADFVGVTKQMISKYEHDSAKPSTEVMFKLIKMLKFPGTFFHEKDGFSTESKGTFYRSRVSSTQREKRTTEYLKKYLVVLRDYLETYIDFPKLELFNLNINDSPSDAADILRDAWRIGNGPISDMTKLLETKGFILSNYTNDSKKVDAFSGGSSIKENGQKDSRYYYSIILEGDSFSFYREQFSLAHELGHWLLHEGEKFPQEMETLEYKRMENEANQFASEFLLPSDEFIVDAKKARTDLDYFVSLKNKWYVSIGMMIMKSHNLGVINDDDYINLQRRLSYKGWRHQEPFDNTKLSSKPVALRQAIELLIENDILTSDQMLNEIDKRYNLVLPKYIIENLSGLEKGYLGNKNSKIISLR